MDMIETAITESSDFKIFTGLLKASRSNDGKMRLHGVASSTTRDLHGDVMSASAIEDMERAANGNLTIFLNHSYNVPEDVGGSVERAKSTIREVDQDGNPNIDLNLDIVVNDANPRAVQTFEAIERGTKLGLSIGAKIPEGGARRNKDGTFVIDRVTLLETSIVGIPANPRSWVEYAVKSLKNKTVPEDSEEPVTSVSWSPTVTWSNGTYGNISVSTPDIEESVEPDVTEAKVTVIEIDTGDDADDDDPPSQEASESEPEAEDSLLDETAEGDDDALDDEVTRSVEDGLAITTLNEALSLLRQTTRDLVDSRQALADAEIARAAAESARDAARRERDHVLIGTKQILDRIADSPLVRRAVIVDAKRDFRAKFEGIYSEDFLKMLERDENE